MRAASLCSGIEGLGLAVDAAFGAAPAWFCESDPHCRTILERHWPGIDVVPDVREVDAGLPAVDLLHAGYPCQPFSQAGRRAGADDPRHLWPAVLNAVRVLRPGIVVLENVAGHLTLGFDRVLADLAAEGFDAEWSVVRAADAGAPHRRARLFVLAYADDGSGVWERSRADIGEQGEVAADPERDGHGGTGVSRRSTSSRHGILSAEHRPTAADPRCGGLSGGAQPDERPEAGFEASRRSDALGCDAVAWGEYEPAIRRWEHVLGRPAPRPTDDRGRLMPEFVEWMMGFPPGWTDGPARTHRLRMLGNAVVPQQGELALRLLAAA